MKVSVIIPIYNTGRYLRDCVASVCAQTHTDLEIILVDDGSGPETAALCDELGASDSRIIVVHKPNEGVSKARNTALGLASGDVVGFVDSDDTIQPRMYEVMIHALQRDASQIAMCDAVTLAHGRPDAPDTIPDFNGPCVIDTKKIKPATLSRLAGSTWRCVYRRTDTHNFGSLRFPEGLKFSEDRIFNLMAMAQAQRISYLKTPFYNRLIREGSACNRHYPDLTHQITLMRNVLLRTVSKYWGQEFVAVYEGQVANHIRGAISNFTCAEAKNSLELMRGLCNSPSVRQCLQRCDASDLRSKLILKNRPRLLVALGHLTNCYYKICRR